MGVKYKKKYTIGSKLNKKTLKYNYNMSTQPTNEPTS